MQPEASPVYPVAEIGTAIASSVDLQDSAVKNTQHLRRQKTRERVVSTTLLVAVVLVATATAFIIAHCASLFVSRGGVTVRRLAGKGNPEVCGDVGASGGADNTESSAGGGSDEQDNPDGGEEGGHNPFSRVGTRAPVFKKTGVKVKGVYPFEKIQSSDGRRHLRNVFRQVALGDFPESLTRECNFSWGDLDFSVTATTTNPTAVFSTQDLRTMAKDTETAIRQMHANVTSGPSRSSYTAEVQFKATSLPTSEPGVVTVVVKGSLASPSSSSAEGAAGTSKD
ncbi:hypothetical protein Emed_006009 [Eimeria media]